MASFVMSADGEMGFVGMFRNHGSVPVVPGDLERDESFVRMREVIEASPRGDIIKTLDRFAGRLRFDLRPMEELSELQGRLFVRDPVARNYVRLPERTPLPVLEISRAARLVPPMPSFDELTLTATEIRNLPRDWCTKLAEWRGIYLIVDQADGARYVGAAFGVDNLLGRWRSHVAMDAGVTRELSRRNADGFRFSILELLSPAAGGQDVIAQERKWMARLDTIANGLNT